MFRRPPARLVLLFAAVLFVVAVLGVGLLRAAMYRAPEQALPTGVAAPGPAGHCGQAPARATRELRGMWLTTVLNIDFPSRPGLPEAQVKTEYQQWLDLAVAQRHNAIFVHVRPSGDAFWPSAYAPWSQWLTGKRDGVSPGWDPLAYMVTEAHARNLQFHAWFNPYRGSQPAPAGPGADFGKLAPSDPLLRHRDWAIAYPTGRTARLYYDPGNPAARRFVEDAILEAVARYDVDGVHFDDFFYPYPESGQDFGDRASYARYGAGRSRANWRRDNVDTFVREMSERIRKLKPWVRFGISPFGIWRNSETDPAGSATHGLQSYDAIYADTRKWVREGWLDYIVPQLYWAIGFGKADYAVLVPWWAAVVKGTAVQLYVGQADYRIGEPGAWSDPAQLDRQLALNDRYGVQGEVHFSAAQVRADRLGAVTRYRDHHYAVPALVPRFGPPPPATAGAPGLVGARRVPAGTLDFAARANDSQAGTGQAGTGQAGGGDGPVGWALYRVADGAAALVAMGRTGTPVADPAPPRGAGVYCLSTFDRWGNESMISAPLTVDGS